MEDFKRTTAKVPCDICRDPNDPSELIALGCEHYFHKGCFTEYLVKKVGIVHHMSPHSCMVLIVMMMMMMMGC